MSNNTYTMMSLFDGSGGFSLAASMCGIAPVYASEVEPYPIAVTRERFPHMKHLGDISKINGAQIEPVDIITFGSPCQDLSVAGKRAGLKHVVNGDDETTRSGLFMDAVRIIKEMRKATNGLYPNFIIWENVPGAFSSNSGEDFRTVLEEIIKIVEPTAVMPSVPKNGWSYADSYRGDGWSLAYRTFDAQYWGTAQRRRRIYLVADLRGQRAQEILFKRAGLRGYFETGRTPWQGIAADAERSAFADDRERKTYDARGNGDGLTVNTITGDHNNRITDYTSVVVENIHADGELYVLDRAYYNQGANAQYDPQLYDDGTVPTIVARGPDAVAYWDGGQTCGTLTANNAGGNQRMPDKGNFNCVIERKPHYIVRRLTPTECARLQGFPDEWGHIAKKDALTDEEYRFWHEVRNTHAAINGKAVKDYTPKQMLAWYNKLHTDGANISSGVTGLHCQTRFM